MDADLDRLRDLLRRLSVRAGDFVLASGQRASLYVDCRQTTLTAAGHDLIGRLLLGRIRAASARGLGPFVAVGGMALGAAPIASAISTLSNREPPPLDAFLVRKQAKDHGTAASVEGLASRRAGDKVVLVEDVVTSGGSLVAAIDAAERAELQVELALALVDRGAGGADVLRQRGIPFEALFSLDELTPEAP